LAGIPGPIGIGLAGATLVFGFVKPIIYSKNPKVASVMDRMNMISVSDERGGKAFRVRYTLSF
jgi:hypothetical protein